MSAAGMGNVAASDNLRTKLSQLQAERASLKVQLANLQAVPADVPDVNQGGLDEDNDRLARELAGMEGKTVMYRSTGWTCFEIDLDVGRRARETRKGRDSGDAGPEAMKDSDVGLGIRLDTFFRGRYYEAYYLVFARPSQMLETPRLVDTALEDTNEAAPPTADGLQLVRHTLPHFIPLTSLLERYVPALLDGSSGGGGGGGSSSQEGGVGGLSLLSAFQGLPGIEAFLSALHCHLQALVSRREQALSLGRAQLPSASGTAAQPGSAALQVSGTDVYDLIKVVWRVPSDEATVRDGDDAAAPRPDVDDDGAEPAAKRRREDEVAVRSQVDLPSTSVEILVHYSDRRADRLTDPTLQKDPSAQHDDKEDGEEPPPEVFEGTQRPFGRVRIEIVEAPSLVERAKRAAGPREVDVDDLEPERTRREDLEKLFAQEVDGESLELDEAVEAVAERVWQELRGDVERDAMMPTKRQRIHARTPPIRQRNGIDPDPYSRSTPDFAALAAMYPNKLGKHVRMILPAERTGTADGSPGKAYAKIDFQDAEAVRCLAETLLFHDFGLTVELHPDRLCPMVPNRLNYITYIRSLVDHSLAGLRHLEAARVRRAQRTPKRKRQEGATTTSRVRGLDIGTGASAIYPLLGCATEPEWEFVATDIDVESLKHARSIIEHQANNEVVLVPSMATSKPGRGRASEARVNHRLANRIELLQRRMDDSLIPSDDEVGELLDGGIRFHFTMCNPPFYTSEEDMQASANLKMQRPSAVCNGTKNEMVTTGGEVSFILRMVQESTMECNRHRVLWFSSMVGKLSSVSAVVAGIKAAGVDNWAVTKLVQGQTRRWVVAWSFSGLRLPDHLARPNDAKLDSSLPLSTMRTAFVPLDRFRASSPTTSPSTILAALHSVLADLDDCDISQRPQTSTFDVVAWQPSWTRAARRRKARGEDKTSQNASPPQLRDGREEVEPEVCATFSVALDDGVVSTQRWRIDVQWRFGRSRTVFESFAAHVLRKVEDRSVAG